MERTVLVEDELTIKNLILQEDLIFHEVESNNQQKE